MRRRSLHELSATYGTSLAENSPHLIRQSPGWCEARYLRTISSLEDRGAEDWALTWVFAMVDDQPGYALDLALEFSRRFDDATIASIMLEGAVATLRKLMYVPVRTRAWRALIPATVRRTLFRWRRWLLPREASGD